PDDPTPGQYIRLLSKLPVTKPLVDGSRSVVAAIVKTAEQNHRLPDRGDPGARAPFRRNRDELTEHYIRVAAAAAQRLPAEQAIAAYLVGLAVALDDSDKLRQDVITGDLWRAIESDAEREHRIEVIGVPTLRERPDWVSPFLASAA